MIEKMKACFSYHCLVHNLLGIGLGLVIARLFAIPHQGKIGIALIAIAIVLDYLRK